MGSIFMRRAILLTILCLSAVGLAGCGRSNDSVKVATKTQNDGTHTITVTDNKGTQVAMAGPGASANMPTYAPMFPGSSVETTVTVPNRGGMVAFKTKAAVEAVIAFYKKSLGASGFKDNLNMTSGDATTYSASDGQGAHTVNVVATKNADGTEVQVTWN
jgi:hypothetical protein